MKRIVIASVLKPVDDTRMFEKLGCSLADAEYEVHICGFPTLAKNQSKVFWHPLSHFSRISWKRLMMPLTLYRKIKALKPALLIITTHELLTIALLLKKEIDCKVIYDIQENYYRNIRYGKSFPLASRLFVAAYVRLKERLCSGFIDHFFLAEKSYANELTFLREFTVLENKATQPLVVNMNRGRRKLLFSGTLAETTGVFVAIDLATRLHAIDSGITLTIIGYAGEKCTRNQIQEYVFGKPFIKLMTGDSPIRHSFIIHEITSADIGIISYPANPSTSGSVPTKLYEYLAHRLPFLLINHSPWVQIASEYNAAVVFDDDHRAEEVFEEMTSKIFYATDLKVPTWEGEELRLKSAVQQLFA
ncbi:MAG TPA: glycosyltransferase [Chryseosolibacter sp.]|nr:glycosyltransferase [Chryseosolibacter sp.]